MKEVRLNLFKLHDENDKGQGRIKAVLDTDLKEVLKECVTEIRYKMKIKDLSNNLELPYYEFWRCLNKKHIPLSVLERLIAIWSELTGNDLVKKKHEIHEKIKLLSYGAGNTHKIVNARKTLTTQLCKIAGSVVADGHLRYKKKNNFDYGIVIRDQFKDNLDLFADWIKTEFDLSFQPVPDKKQHLWYIDFNNKIIWRYLNKLFEIPYGKKSHIVKIPKLVKDSELIYKQAFVSGVLMFDGGVDHRNGYFDLSTKSKYLLNDVETVFKESQIEPDYISREIDKYSKVYKFRIRARLKLKKVLDLFLEPKTTKWLQLSFHVNGLDNQLALKDLIDKLDSIYPRVRDGVTFIDMINMIIHEKEISSKELQSKVSRGKTVVNEYLKRLEEWNILVSERRGLQKVWSISPDLKQN